ncbi:zinc finger protein 544-like isoform X1 [Limanda limanda]|uniref:zinc finger protein 544-like isoform X1 n=1 Tax=Limanda limanda TaxID=27771 RepID=UPI0029C70A95|nr:zinc finger protein 544-like isoform X1 [Limanda limanda]
MTAAVDFPSKIASIMEVLANAAVAEICKVVDDGYLVIQLEMSQSQKENELLRRKIKLLEVQFARYRAERVRGAEASINSRFPGFRLLNRQSKDSPVGPSLQGRTRFLNRGKGTQQCVQKSQPINLDQDPDQEGVTTTKTESAELQEEGELHIIKVEGAMETMGTTIEVLTDSGIGTGGGVNSMSSLHSTSTDSTDGQPTRCSNVTEGQGCLKNISSAQSPEEKIHEAQGDTPEKERPPHTLLDWQESSETEDMQQQPSCSKYTPQSEPAKSSFSQTRTNVACAFPTELCNMDGVSHECKQDIIVINSSSCREVPSFGRGGDDEETPLGNVRSQYQPLLCIQISDSPSEVIFNNPPVSIATVGSQHQQTQYSWSEMGQMHSACSSSKKHLHESGSAQTQQQQQQPFLSYACTHCSCRYAHQCQLRIHERVHTGEKPYQCTHCGKSFGQFCGLKRHQMVHTGERPFPCPHCGKQFATSTNLKVHQSVHTGEKRFHCSKCGKNFSFLSNLIRHQALHSAK